MKAIKDVVHYRETNNVKGEDFMSTLIEMKQRGTLQEVRGIDLRDETAGQGMREENHMITQQITVSDKQNHYRKPIKKTDNDGIHPV